MHIMILKTMLSNNEDTKAYISGAVFLLCLFTVNNGELLLISFHAKHQATLSSHELMCSNKNTGTGCQVESLLFDVMHLYRSKMSIPVYCC